MHRTVPVECLGESYFWFMLFKTNKLFCVKLWDVCSNYVADSIQKSWDSLNMPKYNIKVNIEEIALIITRTENNFKNTYSQYRHFQSRYLVERMNVLTIWFSSVKSLCPYIL